MTTIGSLTLYPIYRLFVHFYVCIIYSEILDVTKNSHIYGRTVNRCK